ncbi:MAG: hypothetical protein N4A49_02845 [Marinifilaceae bacterium]|jgi:hypothetical protein|nr:hypothetical protein [Marinifilaceae bacterium]
MRNRFQQELTIYFSPISDLEIPKIARDELPQVLKVLQSIFITAELNNKVFKLLESEIKISKMGRQGMDLWQILVLAVIRNSHSAVESNINQLESNGLDKCPDKGFKNFKRHSAIGVLSCNLDILGKILINKDIEAQKHHIAA